MEMYKKSHRSPFLILSARVVCFVDGFEINDVRCIYFVQSVRNLEVE